MKVFVLTLFPEMFTSVLNESILKRAREKGILQVELVNIRDFSHDPHRTCDDYPYGGGPGMVMKPEPIFEAVESVEEKLGRKPLVVLLTPQGQIFTGRMAAQLSKEKELVLIAGHYEGFDERVRSLANLEVSIGDYVLTGGELPAMVVLDAVARFLPGVLGDEDSAYDDSFSDGLLEGPQYTRPENYRGMSVPRILLEGDHLAIKKWRRKEAIRRTFERRPELLTSAVLTYEDRRFLQEIIAERRLNEKRTDKE